MRITDIQERQLSIASNIRNAYIDFSKMTLSAVAITTDIERGGRPVVGYGFNSNGRYAQSGILQERIIPRVLEAPPEDLLDASETNLDPERIWRLMMRNEKPGGHGERSVAVGVIDMALWDIVAKVEGKPLYQVLADRYRGGQADSEVFVYAAGGYYYPGKGTDDLVAELRSYLEMGYDTAYGEALEPYGLRWYEEAGDPLDYQLQARLAATYALPLATGENLFSHQDVRNLLRYGGMRSDRDVLQMDPVLSYGLVDYLRMLVVLHEHDWSPRRCIPHGGHQFALNIAAGLGLGGNESYPHVFAPFGGFADDTPIEGGRVGLPDVPGVGFEAKRDLYELLQATFA